MSTTREWLDAAQARIDDTAASPFVGPGWIALHGGSWAGQHVVADESGHPLLIGGEGEMARADVDFAAAARTDLPRAVAALRAVLAFVDEQWGEEPHGLIPEALHEHTIANRLRRTIDQALTEDPT